MLFKKKTNHNPVILKDIDEHREHFKACYPFIPVDMMKKMGSVGMSMLMVLDVATEDQRHAGDVNLAARIFKQNGEDARNEAIFRFPEKSFAEFPDEVQEYITPYLKFEKKYDRLPYTEFLDKLINSDWNVIKGMILLDDYMIGYMSRSESGWDGDNQDALNPSRKWLVSETFSYLTYYEHPDYEKRESLRNEIEGFLHQLALDGIARVEQIDKDVYIEELCKQRDACREDNFKNRELAKKMSRDYSRANIVNDIATDTRITDILKKYVSPAAYYCTSDVIDTSKDFDPKTMWFTSRPELYMERFKERAYRNDVPVVMERHEQWLKEYGPDAWKKQ